MKFFVCVCARARMLCNHAKSCKLWILVGKDAASLGVCLCLEVSKGCGLRKIFPWDCWCLTIKALCYFRMLGAMYLVTQCHCSEEWCYNLLVMSSCNYIKIHVLIQSASYLYYIFSELFTDMCNLVLRAKKTQITRCLIKSQQNLLKQGVVSVIHKRINSIWNIKELREEWKELILVLVSKKGDKTDCTNYRGIALTNRPQPRTLQPPHSYGNQRLQRQFDGLLMMGIVMLETCWAVSVRQSNKILRLIVASSWVFYWSDNWMSSI